MTKKKLTIVIIICLTLAIALTGCGVSFPSSVEKLLSSTDKIWKESISSVIDTYKISSTVFSLPVEIAGIGAKTLTIDISGGELMLERIFYDDLIELNLSFANFSVVADNQLRIYLNESGIFLDKFSSVNGVVNLKFTPTSLSANSTFNNLNLIKADLPPIYTQEDNFSSSNYRELFNKIQSFGAHTVFGTILDTGKLDKSTNSYSYLLPKEKVHDELLRLPKLLVDILGGNKIQGSDNTIHSILKSYFATNNIVDIANAYINTKDMKVLGTLDKTKKNYYISKLSGNYMGQGTLPRAITKKIFEDIIRNMDSTNGMLNLITLMSGMSITANISIASTIKLK